MGVIIFRGGSMSNLDMNYIADLVKQAQQGESNAFAEFFAATYAKQYHFALGYLKEPFLAQQAIQKTYNQALAGIRKITEPMLSIAWLTQLNLDNCFSLSNHAPQHTVTINGTTYDVSLILAMPFTESQAVLLKYACGMKNGDIASLMEIRSGDVRNYLGRALARLQEINPMAAPVRQKTQEKKAAPEAINIKIGKANKILDLETAGQILSNTFDFCGEKHSTIPLEALCGYANYRKERYLLQRGIILTMMLLFLLLPTLFISAKIAIAVKTDSDSNPAYQVKVDASVPVEQIIVTVDGKNVPVYEAGNNEYIIRPGSNGELLVTVTLINKQTSTADITITEVDNEAPELLQIDTWVDPPLMVLSLSDESGIDFDHVTVTDHQGISLDFSYDEEKSILYIAYPEEAVTISVPDKKGNVLTLELRNKNAVSEQTEP